MMQNLGITFVVELETGPVLETLERNRAKHTEMVREATVNYVKKAKETLSKRLGELEEGKIASLGVYLTAPVDHTDAYDTAIAMLKGHQGETVKLNGDEHRHLIQDVWGWSASWATTNSDYSPSTRAYAAEKRLVRE